MLNIVTHRIRKLDHCELENNSKASYCNYTKHQHLTSKKVRYLMSRKKIVKTYTYRADSFTSANGVTQPKGTLRVR